MCIRDRVKIDSKGPVFYKQERMTINKKIFHVLKFRTMVQDAERVTGATLALEDDPRITRVGKVDVYKRQYEHYGIEPDIFTLAKALGNGIPIGAVCAKNEVAQAFSPGDHGSTFGGNGFACQAGLMVLSIIEKEKVVQNAAEVGGYFKENLQKMRSPLIIEVRGVGLMLSLIHIFF